MNTKKRLLSAPIALALGLALSSTASAASAATAAPAAPPSGAELYFVVDDVVHGSIEGVPGNRHQIQLGRYGTDASGWMRSWSCPDGATVTMNWVSSRCEYRLTQDLRERWAHEPFAWVSSTGRSGIFEADDLVGANRATGYRRVIPTRLTLHAGSDAEVFRFHLVDVWTSFYAWGDIGGAPVWTTGAKSFGWAVN